MQERTNDLQVVQAYLNGDSQIESMLYHEIKALTENLLRAMEEKGWTFHDRENIVSEIIFQVMVKNDKKVFRSFQGRSKLSTYLWSVARNRIINARRKEKYYRLKTNFDDIDEIANQHQSSEVETIIEEYIENEPPFEKYIKYSKWIQELSYHDIIENVKKIFGDEYSINTQRIAYILHTNRKKLKKNLKS